MVKKIISLLCAISILTSVCASFTYANSSLLEDNNPKIDSYNTVVYNLKDVYKLTDLSVTYFSDLTSIMSGFDIYLSLDNTHYSKVAYVENQRQYDMGIGKIQHKFSPYYNGKYVKIVFKTSEKNKLDIRSININAEKSVAPKNLTKTAKYSYLTTQPFVTGGDIIDADIDTKVLNDGKKDGLITAKSEYTTVVFELDKAYQIGDINIWSMADGINFVDGLEVLYSLNGKKYQPYGYFVNENSRDEGKIVNIKSVGLVGQNARFVKLILHTKDIASIGEVEIFGYDIMQKSSVIPLNIKMKNYLLGYIDWSSYDGNADGYKLYVEKFNFDNVQGLKPAAVFDNMCDEYKSRYCEFSPFEPETTYYVAVTPVDKSGIEQKNVVPKKITTSGVVGDEPKDIFALNYYTREGGGADVSHGDGQLVNENNMIDLIDELNFNKNRWWRHYESELSRFAKKGLSYSVQNVNSIDEIKSDNALGTWTYGQGNESDLHGTNTVQYFGEVKKSYNIIKTADKRNVIAAPVLGGTEPTSLKWLDNFYKADGVNGKEVRNYFDYMDFHAYCKIMDKQVEGLPTCAPEMIYQKLADLKNVMKKYGDQQKPIVATELGWSTFEGRHYLVPVDYPTQRDYLTRLYLILISQDIKEAYLYNFQNSGPDITNFEHNIGVVDWYGQPKPAYYGLYTLSKIMQEAEYIGEMEEAISPYYGLRFRNKATAENITALWSADNQTKTATLYVPNTNGKIKVIGVNGEYRSVNVVDNKATVTISGAPIFIYSTEMVKLENVSTPFSVANTKIDVIRGEKATFSIKRNKIGSGISGKISGKLPEGWSFDGATDFSDTASTIDVVVNIPKDAKEIEHNAVITVVYSDNSLLPINLVFNVMKSLNVSIVPEYVGKTNSWEMAVYVKNMINKPLNATLKVENLQSVNIENLTDVKIENLEQNKVKRIGFALSDVKQSVDATVSICIESDGYLSKIDRVLNFTGVLNDGVTPKIDGVLSKGEWDNSMAVTQNPGTENATLPGWKGEADCSFVAYRKWDKDNFYLAVEVQDNVHFQPGNGDDIWQGDGLQFAIDPNRKDGKGGKLYHEIGIALNNDNAFVGHRWTAPLIIKQGKLINYKGKIRRDGTKTVYEIAIPWSDLVDGPAPKAGDILGFSLLVNDNDGGGRRGWVEFMDGIGSGKDTNRFEDMILFSK